MDTVISHYLRLRRGGIGHALAESTALAQAQFADTKATGHWVTIGGHPVHITDKEVGPGHLAHAKEHHGVSDAGHKVLSEAHAQGRVKTEEHLYRSIARAKDLLALGVGERYAYVQAVSQHGVNATPAPEAAPKGPTGPTKERKRPEGGKHPAETAAAGGKLAHIARQVQITPDEAKVWVGEDGRVVYHVTNFSAATAIKRGGIDPTRTSNIRLGVGTYAMSAPSKNALKAHGGIQLTLAVRGKSVTLRDSSPEHARFMRGWETKAKAQLEAEGKDSNDNLRLYQQIRELQVKSGLTHIVWTQGEGRSAVVTLLDPAAVKVVAEPQATTK